MSSLQTALQPVASSGLALFERKEPAKNSHNATDPILKLLRKIYRVENQKKDELDRLLKQVDGEDRANILVRWKKRSFDKARGYIEFSEYEFKYFDKLSPISWADAGDLFNRGMVPHATTRELLSLFISNKRNIRQLLKAGYRIIVIGKDDFNFLGMSGTTLRLCHEKILIESIDETVEMLISSKDLFVFRCSK